MRIVLISAIIFLSAYSAYATNCNPLNTYDIAANTAYDRVLGEITSDFSEDLNIDIKQISNTPVNERFYTRTVDVTASRGNKVQAFQVGVAVDANDCQVFSSTVVKVKSN